MLGIGAPARQIKEEEDRRVPLSFTKLTCFQCIICEKSPIMSDFSSSFDMPSAGLSENADAAELQRLIAVEQQKAQFQAQVTHFSAKLTFNSMQSALWIVTVFDAVCRFITSRMYAGISVWTNQVARWTRGQRHVSLAAWSASSTQLSVSRTALRRWSRRARTD